MLNIEISDQKTGFIIKIRSIYPSIIFGLIIVIPFDFVDYPSTRIELGLLVGGSLQYLLDTILILLGLIFIIFRFFIVVICRLVLFIAGLLISLIISLTLMSLRFAAFLARLFVFHLCSLTLL